MERLNAWNKYDEDMKKKVFDFADFLSGRFASLPLDTMNYILTTPKMQVLF